MKKLSRSETLNKFRKLSQNERKTLVFEYYGNKQFREFIRNNDLLDLRACMISIGSNGSDGSNNTGSNPVSYYQWNGADATSILFFKLRWCKLLIC